MSKLTLVNGQNVDFSLDAQTSGTGSLKVPDLAGATKYQVPAASAAHAAELAKLGVKGADIASASTTNLETATGELVDVTGTTTITAITLSEGHRRIVRFTGPLTLTHGASLVLPGAANIITAAGDVAVFEGYAAGVVRCVGYMRAGVAPWSAATLVAKRLASNLVVSSSSFVTLLELSGLVPSGAYLVTLSCSVTDALADNGKIKCAQAIPAGEAHLYDYTLSSPSAVINTDSYNLAAFAAAGMTLDGAFAGGTVVACSEYQILWKGWCVATAGGLITVQAAQKVTDAVNPLTFAGTGGTFAPSAMAGNTYITAQLLNLQ